MCGIMCDGRQNGGPMGEHPMSDPPCRIDMPMPIPGPGIMLHRNMGGGGGAKPTLSVPARHGTQHGVERDLECAGCMVRRMGRTVDPQLLQAMRKVAAVAVGTMPSLLLPVEA
jgi:hypothetical protein